MYVAVEGIPDRTVCEVLCKHFKIPVERVFVKRGKSELDRSLEGYNNDAQHRLRNWFVLRDLDSDATCAPELVNYLLPQRSDFFRLRIPVRTIESWLMADAHNISIFLSVRTAAIPRDPEALDKPKEMMINIARRSTKRDIKEDMVPIPGSKHSEGPAYVSRISEFARNHWDIEVASERCDSLARCIKRLSEITQQEIS